MHRKAIYFHVEFTYHPMNVESQSSWFIIAKELVVFGLSTFNSILLKNNLFFLRSFKLHRLNLRSICSESSLRRNVN
jgi:hypothetical protein